MSKLLLLSRLILRLFLACLAIGLVISLLVKIVVVLPYETFHAQERDAVPLFDQLNEQVLNALPPPEGVSEKNRFKVGSDDNSVFQHGRELRVVYSFASSGLSSQEIADHYEQILTQTGWQKFTRIKTVGDRYSKGTTCVWLISGPQPNSEYIIFIWYDFLNQSFSPRLPPPWIVFLNELYLQAVLQCP